jgi:hypothetical protein
MRTVPRLPRVLLALAVLAIPGAAAAQSASDPLHAPYDALLRAHVRDGLVDYDAFERAPAFAAYLDALARTDPTTLPRPQQLAFWINAYNAYTIAQINAHHERRSIKNINKTLGFASIGGAWREKMARVGGVAYSLDEIEHERIRPVFKEPRIHFAIVCAALGCPPLRSEAYVGERLDEQLDDQTRAFLLRAPAKNRVEVATKTVYLSPIFRWFKDDFAPTDPALLQWIARYFPAGAEADVLTAGRARIKWTAYDWSLNLLGTK